LDRTAEKFVSYTFDVSYADLTPGAVHAAKRCVVDALGCAIGSFHEAPLKAIRNLACGINARDPATIIGTRIRTSPELAAFTNGSMIRYGDFSDDYFGLSGDSGPHPSDNIGGILAAAESAGENGKALILGIAVAYEACGQIADSCSLAARGWDYAMYHALATALGAGKVLGLSRGQLRNALGLALVPNIGLLQTRMGELSNWKGCAGPNGSRNGLFAALLAREGLTGPDEPFEGQAGFKKQLGQSFELGDFGGGAIPYKVEGTAFKYLPINYSGQLPTGTALELRKRVKHKDIESICVYLVTRYAVTRADKPHLWDPQTRETADHSLPYQIGAALIDGEITHHTFTPERFRDPAILALVQKVRLEPDAGYTAVFPKTFNCRFEVKLKSGELVTLHRTNPKGHPANPMSDDEINEKFLSQIKGLIPKKRARALLDLVWNLEQVNDLKELFTLTRIPAKSA